MGLFSEELLELDRNTVQLMIDEMAKELENLKMENQGKVQTISRMNEEIVEKDQIIAELQKRIEELEKNNTESTSTPNIP